MKVEAALEDEARLRRLLRWFLEPLTDGEWTARKSAIEDHVEAAHTILPAGSPDRALSSVSTSSDRMGWYLYLLDVALNDPPKCEPTQGARVLPIFQRLAEDMELLLRLGGVEDKRTRLMGVDRANPDSGLFEVLVGLLWKRNGWKNVTFVPEAPPHKRPDLEAASKRKHWAIECKRLAKSSAYSDAEREKWLRMWRPLSEMLVDRRYPIVLEIVFHVELESLPDDFLVDELRGKLALAIPPCSLVANDKWDVRVRRVEMQAVRRHLRSNFVKYPSTQLNELIAGPIDPNRGFTCVVRGKMVRIGEGLGNNRFLDELDFAAGAYWHCDAERSIERKARDIRTRLAEAVEQIPVGHAAVVHIGLETLDGMLVEATRYKRIMETVSTFDLRGKDVRWVYCHLYQSYAPPDRGWVLDETVYYFGKHRPNQHRPLKHAGTIVPTIDNEGLGVHWLKPPP